MSEQAVQNNEKKPLVSVIIPAYNAAATLPLAIKSALKQDVSLEVLVIDDCSAEDLEKICRQFQSDGRVIYERNKQNMGAAASRNKAVQKARGYYVAFLDSDDYWAEGKLRRQIDLMRREKCVLCATGRELMTPEGELTGRVIGMKERITYRELLKHNSINCSSVVLETKAAREFPMEYEDSHEDYITWLKILKKYRYAAGINEPLLKYRLSNSGKSGNKLQSAAMTFRVYRYMGFGPLRSCACFVSYAFHGIMKYGISHLKRIETQNQ